MQLLLNTNLEIKGYRGLHTIQPLTMLPSSLLPESGNPPVESRGRLGERGGTGGGTLIFEPGGLSHSTAGRLSLSCDVSSYAVVTEPCVGVSNDATPNVESVVGEVTPVNSGECTTIAPRTAGDPTLKDLRR